MEADGRRIGMLYERIDVCRRIPEKDEVVVYRCLRLLSGTGYVVQSADRIALPLSKSDLELHELRFWELLCEEAPEARSSPLSTLEAAINEFDREFENVWE